MHTTANLWNASEIITIYNDLANIYMAVDRQAGVDYFYGGTRIVDCNASVSEIEALLKTLMLYESKIKNELINIALQSDALAEYTDRVPDKFLESTVGGARCLIQPKNELIASIIKNPQHPEFKSIILRIFESIGKKLNQEGGRIKLTPDFGRYAELADLLARFTPHVLGIQCEEGGCGGKSSYTTSGIVAAFERMPLDQNKETSITLIGSAGAMGSDLVKYFTDLEFNNIALCDLAYNDRNFPQNSLKNLTILPARFGKFTEPCLKRGEIIIATTIGQELDNSNWKMIPANTTLFLAHNLAIPHGVAGINLVKSIAKQGVMVIPGQVLTLGGALTARLEWFWRQSNPNQPFNKELAHAVVKNTVSFWIDKIQQTTYELGITPYEAMLYCVNMQVSEFEQ